MQILYIIRIEIGTIMNSWRALSQKNQYFHVYLTFYSDSTKITNFYVVGTFTLRIALYVLIFSILSARLFELWLKIDFLKITKKIYILGCKTLGEPFFLGHLDLLSNMHVGNHEN